jgi:hypothetical protein
MPKPIHNRPISRYSAAPDGRITTPPGSPKILIHVRRGRFFAVYCNQPAKVLCVETKGKPQQAVDPRYLEFLSLISPQTSIKLVGRCGTSVDHMLAMQFDEPMNQDLHRVLMAHEIMLDEDWPDVE